jgi:hypothetical protein
MQARNNHHTQNEELRLNTALEGVNNYINRSNDALVTPKSYGKRGLARANCYKTLLESDFYSNHFKSIIVDALLAIDEECALKNHVQKSLIQAGIPLNNSHDIYERCRWKALSIGLHDIDDLHQQADRYFSDYTKLLKEISAYIDKHGNLSDSLITAIKWSESLLMTKLVEILPTQPSLQQNQTVETIMSDHLPKRYNVNGISILSYNTMPPDRSAVYNHENVQTETRLKNIGKFLKTADKIYPVDFIALQGVSNKYMPLYFPQKYFMKDHLLHGEGSKGICYNSSKWELLEKNGKLVKAIAPALEAKNIPNHIIQQFTPATFKNRETGEFCIVYNVYLVSEDDASLLPDAMHLVQQIHHAQFNYPTIMVGDFNLSIPDISIRALDNANSLAPLAVRQTQPRNYDKAYDYTDACFLLNGENIEYVRGVTLDTKNPGRKFEKPLLNWDTITCGTNYTPLIFPNMHEIRVLDEANTCYAGISIESFMNRLQFIASKIEVSTRLQITECKKNRYGMMKLTVKFNDHNGDNIHIPYLYDMCLAHSDQGYEFNFKPHTIENDHMREKLAPDAAHLNTLELIDKHNQCKLLPLPSLLTMNIIETLKEIDLNAFGHAHEGLGKIRLICHSNQPEEHIRLYNRRWKNYDEQWRDVVKECQYRVSAYSSTVSYSFFDSKNRNPGIYLLYRAIAQFEENIALKGEIASLVELMIVQQKREFVALLKIQLERLRKEAAGKGYAAEDSLLIKINACQELINIISDSDCTIPLFVVLARNLDVKTTENPRSLREILTTTRNYVWSAFSTLFDTIANSELGKHPVNILFPERGNKLDGLRQEI